MRNALRLYRNIALALTATSLSAAPALAATTNIAEAPALAATTNIAAAPALAAPFSLSDGVRLAQNERPRDQDRAFRATRDGRSMPLPMIERRVMPHMGGADYLGPELRGETYRLKFMQDGHVIWIDVDAATGRIVRRSGH